MTPAYEKDDGYPTEEEMNNLKEWVNERNFEDHKTTNQIKFKEEFQCTFDKEGWDD